jgi:exodeoxyribonuclease VII large subunit
MEVVEQRIARLSEKLAATWQVAELVHPDRPLARGFARVTNRDGATLTSAERARGAKLLTLHFADGTLDAAAGAAESARSPAVERKPRRTYIAPQPGFFDEDQG